MKNKILLLFIILAGIANAQHTIQYNFTGGTDSKRPMGDLIFDGTFFYGTTAEGGTTDKGTLFKIKPDGTGYYKLHNFDGTNGSTPKGSLVSDGTFLYGMTFDGGSANFGTIFKIKPDGTGFVKMLDFTGTANGRNPAGSLLLSAGILYGMAAHGGVYDTGTLFKINTSGSGFAIILNFTDGTAPQGSLIFDGTYLYGMTEGGGPAAAGIVFKIKPDGTGFLNLHDFGVGFSSDGRWPLGKLAYDGTYLYGMTVQGGTGGCGVIFKLKSDGTGYTILKDLTSYSNGCSPWGGFLIQGGYLYGMTASGGVTGLCGTGGCGGGCGILFKIKTDGTDYNMYSFGPNSCGRFPLGGLVSDGTFFYGTTSGGGTNLAGTIFKTNPLTVGIAEQIVAQELTVYPNPFSNETTIELSVELDKATLSVFNTLGQEVKHIKNIVGQTILLSRDNLPAGVYFICLVEDEVVVAKSKFIIID